MKIAFMSCALKIISNGGCRHACEIYSPTANFGPLSGEHPHSPDVVQGVWFWIVWPQVTKNSAARLAQSRNSVHVGVNTYGFVTL